MWGEGEREGERGGVGGGCPVRVLSSWREGEIYFFARRNRTVLGRL